MVLWGFVAFLASTGVLMQLGTRWHNNYEYFGNYPVLYFGPALLAFIAPAILSSWRGRCNSPDGKQIVSGRRGRNDKTTRP
jgi:hypothetical protein